MKLSNLIIFQRKPPNLVVATTVTSSFRNEVGQFMLFQRKRPTRKPPQIERISIEQSIRDGRWIQTEYQKFHNPLAGALSHNGPECRNDNPCDATGLGNLYIPNVNREIM